MLTQTARTPLFNKALNTDGPLPAQGGHLKLTGTLPPAAEKQGVSSLSDIDLAKEFAKILNSGVNIFSKEEMTGVSMVRMFSGIGGSSYSKDEIDASLRFAEVKEELENRFDALLKQLTKGKVIELVKEACAPLPFLNPGKYILPATCRLAKTNEQAAEIWKQIAEKFVAPLIPEGSVTSVKAMLALRLIDVFNPGKLQE